MNNESLETISTNITSAPESKSLLEAGIYNAVCIGIADLGMQTSTFDGAEKIQRKISIAFALETKNGWGETPVLSRKFTLSFNEKAALANFLAAWKVPTEKITDIISKSAQLLLTISEDGKYNNIANVLPPKQKVPVPQGIYIPSFWFDRGWKIYNAVGVPSTRRPKVLTPNDGEPEVPLTVPAMNPPVCTTVDDLPF